MKLMSFGFFLAVVVGAILAFGLIWFWPNWIFLWDGYGHRGVYRCSNYKSGPGIIVVMGEEFGVAG